MNAPKDLNIVDNALLDTKPEKASKHLGLLIPGWIITAISLFVYLFLFFTLITTKNGLGTAVVILVFGAPCIIITDVLSLIASILFFVAFGKCVSDKKDGLYYKSSLVLSIIFAVFTLLLIASSYFMLKLAVSIAGA